MSFACLCKLLQAKGISEKQAKVLRDAGLNDTGRTREQQIAAIEVGVLTGWRRQLTPLRFALLALPGWMRIARTWRSVTLATLSAGEL